MLKCFCDHGFLLLPIWLLDAEHFEHRSSFANVCVVQLYWEHVVATQHILFIWWTIFSRSSYVEWINSKRITFLRLFCSLNFASFYIWLCSVCWVFFDHLLNFFFCSFRTFFHLSVYSISKKKKNVNLVASILVRCSFLEGSVELIIINN